MPSPLSPTLLAKLSHQYGRHWGGCLLPSEIEAIADAGALLDATKRQDVARAKERRLHGDGTPTWFYFDIRAGGALATALAQQAVTRKKGTFR